MKRIVSILLLFFYLTTAIGIHLHKHLCGDAVAAITTCFNKIEEKDCCGSNTCNSCSDEEVSIKVKDVHFAKTDEFAVKKKTSDELVYTNTITALPFVKRVFSTNYYHSGFYKILLPQKKLYQTYCTYLI